MAKQKLTLYVDDKTSRMAHEMARSTGKSVSELVREFTVRMYQQIELGTILPGVVKWIGALKTRRSYRHLRDQTVRDRLRRYEGPR